MLRGDASNNGDNTPLGGGPAGVHVSPNGRGRISAEHQAAIDAVTKPLPVSPWGWDSYSMAALFVITSIFAPYLLFGVESGIAAGGVGFFVSMIVSGGTYLWGDQFAAWVKSKIPAWTLKQDYSYIKFILAFSLAIVGITFKVATGMVFGDILTTLFAIAKVLCAGAVGALAGYIVASPIAAFIHEKIVEPIGKWLTANPKIKEGLKKFLITVAVLALIIFIIGASGGTAMPVIGFSAKIAFPGIFSALKTFFLSTPYLFAAVITVFVGLLSRPMELFINYFVVNEDASSYQQVVNDDDKKDDTDNDDPGPSVAAKTTVADAAVTATFDADGADPEPASVSTHSPVPPPNEEEVAARVRQQEQIIADAKAHFSQPITSPFKPTAEQHNIMQPYLAIATGPANYLQLQSIVNAGGMNALNVENMIVAIQTRLSIPTLNANYAALVTTIQGLRSEANRAQANAAADVNTSVALTTDEKRVPTGAAILSSADEKGEPIDEPPLALTPLRIVTMEVLEALPVNYIHDDKLPRGCEHKHLKAIWDAAVVVQQEAVLTTRSVNAAKAITILNQYTDVGSLILRKALNYLLKFPANHGVLKSLFCAFNNCDLNVSDDIYRDRITEHLSVPVTLTSPVRKPQTATPSRPARPLSTELQLLMDVDKDAKAFNTTEEDTEKEAIVAQYIVGEGNPAFAARLTTLKTLLSRRGSEGMHDLAQAIATQSVWADAQQFNDNGVEIDAEGQATFTPEQILILRKYTARDREAAMLEVGMAVLLRQPANQAHMKLLVCSLAFANGDITAITADQYDNLIAISNGIAASRASAHRTTVASPVVPRKPAPSAAEEKLPMGIDKEILADIERHIEVFTMAASATVVEQRAAIVKGYQSLGPYAPQLRQHIEFILQSASAAEEQRMRPLLCAVFGIAGTNVENDSDYARVLTSLGSQSPFAKKVAVVDSVAPAGSVGLADEEPELKGSLDQVWDDVANFHEVALLADGKPDFTPVQSAILARYVDKDGEIPEDQDGYIAGALRGFEDAHLAPGMRNFMCALYYKCKGQAQDNTFELDDQSYNEMVEGLLNPGADSVSPPHSPASPSARGSAKASASTSVAALSHSKSGVFSTLTGTESAASLLLAEATRSQGIAKIAGGISLTPPLRPC